MDIIEIFEKFPTQDDCLAYLEKVRWGNKPSCPYCKSDKHTSLPKEKRHHCNNCNTSFSATVGTIFHQTHLPLQKWLLAVSLILNAKKCMSARQLARHLKVHRNTAWRMAMKIRDAMFSPEQRGLLQGVVEMDETNIGGKPRKERKNGGGNDGGNTPPTPNKRGRGTKKVPVVRMAQRGGNVVASVQHNKKLVLCKN